jgi:hypothetical protein
MSSRAEFALDLRGSVRHLTVLAELILVIAQFHRGHAYALDLML